MNWPRAHSDGFGGFQVFSLAIFASDEKNDLQSPPERATGHDPSTIDVQLCWAAMSDGASTNAWNIRRRMKPAGFRPIGPSAGGRVRALSNVDDGISCLLPIVQGSFTPICA